MFSTLSGSRQAHCTRAHPATVAPHASWPETRPRHLWQGCQRSAPACRSTSTVSCISGCTSAPSLSCEARKVFTHAHS
eukprot:7524389-Alexandrium_andersonii.AAC.1